MNRGDRIKALTSTQERESGFAGMQVDQNLIEGQFTEWSGQTGADWNESKARARFNGMLDALPDAYSAKDRARLLERFEGLVKEKRSEQNGSIDMGLVNTNLTSALKANLAERYPDITEAALQKLPNLQAILAYGDSARKRASQAFASEFRTRAAAAIRAETARQKVTKLSPEQQQLVLDKVLQDMEKNPALMNKIFPPIKGQQSQQGQGQAQKADPPPPGTRPVAAPTFVPARLNSAPQERIDQWKQVPLLSPADTEKMLAAVLNRQPLPSALRRAATRAGITPEQLLLKQVDLYPRYNFGLTPEMRRQIQSSGNRVAGAQASVQGAAPSEFKTAMAGFTNLMANVLTGSAPVNAATMGFPTAYPRGAAIDPGQWSSGPAVAASHPDAGSGYTLPGMRDANGRPLILAQAPANSFAAMVRDSGGQVKASDVASGKRSGSKNQAVGGAAGSEHLHGNAMDIHGSSIAWIRKNGARYGWYVNDYDGSHGGHVEFRGGGSARPQATTRRGGGMTGLATYYTGTGGSDGVAGGPTANGERYDPSKMTAAVQWSLRGKYLNKWVQVEDMDTGKRVRVWVNDVGQMGGSERSVNRQDPRVIDLSPAAFKKLFGSTSRGVGRIRIVEG
jgi:rare lipoprotein A (peptidoglycan hydrolase)